MLAKGGCVREEFSQASHNDLSRLRQLTSAMPRSVGETSLKRPGRSPGCGESIARIAARTEAETPSSGA